MLVARSMLGLALLALAAVGSTAAACDLRPRSAGPQSPGDNHYRLLLNGDIERYAPEQRYVVTLVGSRTHDVVQQFTRFHLTLEPLDPAAARSRRQGRFELFADTLTRFDDECLNSVVEADDLPKTEVQVMWKAPPAGSGCVLLKAMVYENASRWFAEDGQLTRRVCVASTSVDATDCCACDDAKYQMVFEGLWSEHTHPKQYPKEAQWLTHFSDVIGTTHPRNFTFWGEGEIATDGFRSLAEWGSVGLLERELRQRRGLRSIVKAAGLWYPRVNANTTAAFTVDRKRPYLSLASMFGPSPDWVVGVSGLTLCARDCSWVPSKVIDLYPYDAGTDNGISYMSPNSETIPREKMYRITTMYPEDPRAPFYNPGGEMKPMARLYLTREKLVPRSCDEEVLQALVAEEAENTQSTNKPECAVGEWGAWSACSVTCGKGLRMRTREYRMPQKAQMFACDRQLVSKEMCVADVPECESDGANEADTELEAAVEDGACSVSEWGPWSECSVTCGVGVATRRRHFLDRMGPKKCPLVQIEENRKCMQPACTEEAGADEGVSDPQCPTTPWSAWSACSASCGRGVAFRTRLLLVPAAQQADCAARTELLQHRPCTERDSCEIDMLTAKRICMEAPERGPCRGVYQRWAFVAIKGMCVPFTYGGCRGNQNNFISQDDCTRTCSVLLGGAGGPGGQGGALDPSGAAPLPPAVNAAPGQSGADAGPQPEDCAVSAWSAWSRCSVSCGTGYQQRTRRVLAQARPGGAPCPSRLEHRRRCYRAC